MSKHNELTGSSGTKIDWELKIGHGWQIVTTWLSTHTPTQPQLNSQFDRDRVQVGAQCLNPILFLPQLTSQVLHDFSMSLCGSQEKTLMPTRKGVSTYITNNNIMQGLQGVVAPSWGMELGQFWIDFMRWFKKPDFTASTSTSTSQIS